MLMSEAGERFVVADDYCVKIEQGDNLVVVVGADYGSPASLFDHPNLAGKSPHIHEFKHYRHSGSKFWTARAGMDFYFVIPKNKIEMVAEKGYSYVPVLINGLKITLNVSGCGAKDWVDWVGHVVHTHAGCTVKTLKTLAAVALHPDKCQGSFRLREMTEREQQRFTEMAAAIDLRNTLQSQDRIILKDGCDVQRPLFLKERPIGRKAKQMYICVTPEQFRYGVAFKHINWTATATANNYRQVIPQAENRVGEVFREAA
jgi:hypothetical protein